MIEIEQDASPKCREFVAALEALCLAHGVALSVGGYDPLQVWKLGPGEDAVSYSVIEDFLTLPSEATK